jgi:uncharacterized protein YecE (DUF72 family)
VKDQLGLFATEAIEPVITEEDRDLAKQLPSFVRFGTSSWSFPGWSGLVWKGKPTEAMLAKDGLGAYAQQPLFRTVGLDRTHYRPLCEEDLRGYLAQLEIARAKAPDLLPFRVVSKVWDEVTTAIFPRGPRAGQPNRSFLDPGVFRSEVLHPYQRVGATGPFVFELTPMPPRTFDEHAFVSKVERFLEQLPSGHRWAFELRNQELFTPRYVDMLRANGAAHVFNYWSAMPSLRIQMKANAQVGRFVIVRLMLPPFTKYETRKADFKPFDRLREPQPEMRNDVIDILRAAAAQGAGEVFILVNNKAEGSSPLTIRELAKRVVEAHIS